MAKFPFLVLGIPLALVMIALLVVGCDQTKVKPLAEDPAPDLRAWTGELPKAEAPAIGAAVWAAIPREDGTVRPGAFIVEAAADGALTLGDESGTSFPDIPAALVRPRASEAPKAGDVVLAELSGGVVILARSLDDSTVSLVANGRLVESKALTQESLDPSFETMRPVLYRDAIGWQRGLALAAESATYWLQTADGRVEKKSSAEVEKLDPDVALSALQVGDAVLAGAWARGFEEGTVAEIVAPGLAYRVEVAGEVAVYGFDHLLLPPAPWQSGGGDGDGKEPEAEDGGAG